MMRATYKTLKSDVGGDANDAVEKALEQAVAFANSKGPQRIITVGISHILEQMQRSTAWAYVAFWED